MSGRRRFRPGSGDLLGMMLLNGIVAAIVLALVFALFGAGERLEAGWSRPPGVGLVPKWETFSLLVMGATITYAFLWYWLAFTGRSRGVSWGGACLYGVLLAFANVPLAGLLRGLLHGNPLLGILLALLSLLLLPALLFSMTTFGLIMGAFNAAMAERWIERHRPR